MYFSSKNMQPSHRSIHFFKQVKIFLYQYLFLEATSKNPSTAKITSKSVLQFLPQSFSFNVGSSQKLQSARLNAWRMWHNFSIEFTVILQKRSSDMRESIIPMQCPISHQFMKYFQQISLQNFQNLRIIFIIHGIFWRPNMLIDNIFMNKENDHTTMFGFSGCLQH